MDIRQKGDHWAPGIINQQLQETLILLTFKQAHRSFSFCHQHPMSNPILQYVKYFLKSLDILHSWSYQHKQT